MSNAWGQLTWGEGLWGQQGNQIISLSGFALTTNLGGFTQTTVGEATGIALTSSLNNSLNNHLKPTHIGGYIMAIFTRYRGQFLPLFEGITRCLCLRF